MRLLDVEAPDQALKTRLKMSFNTGFAAGQTGFPKCDDRARAETARIAQHGRVLADQLGAP